MQDAPLRTVLTWGACWGLDLGGTLLGCMRQGCGFFGGGLQLGRSFWLPRDQTMVSWNNAVDERLSKENKALTSWVLKAHS